MSIVRQLKEAFRLWTGRIPLDPPGIYERGTSSDTATAVAPRPISEQEIAVIRVALEKGATEPLAPAILDSLENLQAVPGCRCGCESVDFEPYDPERPTRPIAQAIGTTEAGGMVGVIIWGVDDRVTGIEVYDLDFGGATAKLPAPSSIESLRIV